MLICAKRWKRSRRTGCVIFNIQFEYGRTNLITLRFASFVHRFVRHIDKFFLRGVFHIQVCPTPSGKHRHKLICYKGKLWKNNLLNISKYASRCTDPVTKSEKHTTPSVLTSVLTKSKLRLPIASIWMFW